MTNHLQYCLCIPLWFGSHHCKYQQDLHFSAYCLTCLTCLTIANDLICKILKGGKEKVKCLEINSTTTLILFQEVLKIGFAFIFIKEMDTINSFLK